MSDDAMVEWLRFQILARKAAAEAATSGEWASDDGGSIHVGHPVHVVVDWILNDEDLAHVLLQQPQDTIARCEAELRILDACALPLVEVTGPWDVERQFVPGEGAPWAEPVLRLLARGYRHRPGWNPDWAPEGITP